MPDNLIFTHSPIVIFITGATGCGKTTITEKLIQILGEEQSEILSLDWYYKDQSHLPLEIQNLINFDHPDSIDFELLYEHLLLLKDNQCINAPQFDYTFHSRKNQSIAIQGKKYIFLEGILLFHDDVLLKKSNYKIYVDCPLDLALAYSLERDFLYRNNSFQTSINKYISIVRPMYEQFIEPNKFKADLILNNPFADLNQLDFSPIIEELSKLNIEDQQLITSSASRLNPFFIDWYRYLSFHFGSKKKLIKQQFFSEKSIELKMLETTSLQSFKVSQNHFSHKYLISCINKSNNANKLIDFSDFSINNNLFLFIVIYFYFTKYSWITLPWNKIRKLTAEQKNKITLLNKKISHLKEINAFQNSSVRIKKHISLFGELSIINQSLKLASAKIALIIRINRVSQSDLKELINLVIYLQELSKRISIKNHDLRHIEKYESRRIRRGSSTTEFYKKQQLWPAKKHIHASINIDASSSFIL